MKVEILDENPEFDGAHGFEKRINEFIQDKKVIDIKYQSHNQSALIMYEDKKETADKPVVERLKKEKADLDEKIRKLKLFLNDDEKLSSIGIQQPSLMRAQLKIMEQYSSNLELRLYFLER